MRKFVSAIMASLMLATPGLAPAGLVPTTERGVTYVSGGIGEGEVAEILAQQRNFNLKLLFTLVEGNYVADVDVVIMDTASSKVVEHKAEGPFFMARLPAGQYTVLATYDGKSVKRRVSLSPHRLHTEHFRWPHNPAIDFVAAGR